MQYELLDYQCTVAIDVLNRLARARSDWANGDRSSFALSPITGAGKTVIATAVIEATVFGSADLGRQPRPHSRRSFGWDCRAIW
jgi:type III restriction enzyme